MEIISPVIGSVNPGDAMPIPMMERSGWTERMRRMSQSRMAMTASSGVGTTDQYQFHLSNTPLPKSDVIRRMPGNCKCTPTMAKCDVSAPKSIARTSAIRCCLTDDANPPRLAQILNRDVRVGRLTCVAVLAQPAISVREAPLARRYALVPS